MPHKSGINNCYKERYLDPNIKIRCGECQSCKGQEISNKVYAAHVPGKFCKQSNVCSACSSVKYLTRCIRHVCGCKCTRKCELCNSSSSAAEIAFNLSLNHHLKVLHLLMVPNNKKIRPSKIFRYRSVGSI